MSNKDRTQADTPREHHCTSEDLSARLPTPPLDLDSPEIRQQLSTLRTGMTRLVTAFRWEGAPINKTADMLTSVVSVSIPSVSIPSNGSSKDMDHASPEEGLYRRNPHRSRENALGQIEQWKQTLIPFLYEIDRGGVLIPIWIEIIVRGDPPDLPPHTNPVETNAGRIRRLAILMLGNYKTVGIQGKKTLTASKEPLHFLPTLQETINTQDIAQFLGLLATQPDTSLYAVQALLMHANLPAMQALINALHIAKGWAKIDAVEALLSLHQEQFYPLLIANGLKNAHGLEIFIARPLYRTIPLIPYLTGTSPTHTASRQQVDQSNNTHLQQQAALIIHNVLFDALQHLYLRDDTSTIPTIFAQDLPELTRVLLSSTRLNPQWQLVVALYRLNLVIHHYWQAITNHHPLASEIRAPIEKSLLYTNKIETWLQRSGRDVLRATLTNPQEEILHYCIFALHEMHDPQLTSLLIARLNTINTLKDRTQAYTISTICEALCKDDSNITTDRQHEIEQALKALLKRIIDIPTRQLPTKNSEPPADEQVPGSIVYIAILRTLAQLHAPASLPIILNATTDLDHYVRATAIEAIRMLDPNGKEPHSRTAVRAALQDPSEIVVHAASQAIISFQDKEAIALLQNLEAQSSDLKQMIQETLRSLTMG
jgi:hypothetical protein